MSNKEFIEIVIEVVKVICIVATLILSICNYRLNKNNEKEKIAQERELNFIDIYKNRDDSLKKLLHIYDENRRHMNEIFGAGQLGYENKYISGEGLSDENVSKINSIMTDVKNDFDEDVRKAFNKAYSDYQRAKADRYYQEEIDPEIARENENLYFFKFDDEKDFYNLISQKKSFYSEKLN